jgi:hypothetical protein
MHQRMQVSALLHEARCAEEKSDMSRHDALQHFAGVLDDTVLALEERIAGFRRRCSSTATQRGGIGQPRRPLGTPWAS